MIYYTQNIAGDQGAYNVEKRKYDRRARNRKSTIRFCTATLGGLAFGFKNVKKRKSDHRAERIENSKKKRIRSFVWGGIACAVLLMIAISLTTSGSDVGTCVGAFVLSVCAFTFVSCLILGNNFIGDMVVGVASWGFVRFPGLIFSLDLDGIIWFICVKLLFFILGIIFVIITTTLAILLGLALSIFVYPYAIVKNITKPDVE